MTDGPAAQDARTPDIRILSTGITDEDVAAVTAVISGALEELADTGADATPRVSAWQRSQRPIRGTLAPGAGAWRAF